jgi:hypothetical protein
MTRTRVFKLSVAASSALGATYWYYKPTVVHVGPYIPPPFVWDSIPKPILNHLEGHDNVFWKVGTTMVVGYGLDKFMNIIQDPQRTKGVITGKLIHMRKRVMR